MEDKLRVLYVDDEPSLLDIGKMFLEKGGAFSIDTLTSAIVALDQLKTVRYDAIISDYQMPEMDGITFLKQLKASGNNTPFIIFTGRGREEVVIEALNSGADFYIQKGGEPKSQFAELSHKIKTAVNRKKTEKLAKDTERRLYDIINFLPDATFAIDAEGNVIAWNRAIEEMTGIPAQDILGKGDYEYSIPFYGERRPILIDLISTPDEEFGRGKYAIIKKEGDILIAETTLPRPLGRYSVLMGKASFLYNDEGHITGAIESIRDITEQKRADAVLKIQSNLTLALTTCHTLKEALELILDAALQDESLDSGGIYRADPVTGAVDLVAHRGLSPEIVEHTSHFDADAPQILRAKTGIPFYGRYADIRQPGKDEIRDREKITALASIPVLHEGNLVAIMNLASHVHEDIPVHTRHLLETLAAQMGGALVYIRSKDALHESRCQLDAMATNIPGVVYRFCVNPDGTYGFDYISERSRQILGLENDPFTFFDRVTNGIVPESREQFISSIQHAISTKTLWVFDGWYEKPSGKKIWFSAISNPLMENERLIFDGVIFDNTDSKRAKEELVKKNDELNASYEQISAAEEELRANLDEMTRQDLPLKKSQEQLHLAIDSANLGLWDMNLLNGEMVHNQRWAEMLGFSMDELEKPSEWWGQRVHPDDYQNVLNLSNLHRAGKVPFFDAVYRMKHKNGEWRWVHSQGKIILRDSNGAALRLIGVNQDITGQKLAELDILKKNEELEASYEELTATGEVLQQTINDLTQSEQKFSESEEKYRTVFENTGTATVVIEENGIISLANEEFAQLCGFSKDAIEGKKIWTEFVVKEDLDRMLAQHRLRRQDETKALTHYEFRFVTKSGDTRNIFISVGVIPQTKKSVASLLDITDRKLAEEHYQTIFENTGTAMIILEADTTISHVNDEMEKIWGYSKDEIEGRVKWPTLVAAEDLPKMLEYHRLRRRDPDSAPRNYEFRFSHKDGGLRDAALTVSMIPGTKKSVISLRDITELKKIELALRESEERLNFAIESAHLGLWDLNFVTYEVVHNRQWTEMLGFSSAEMDKPSSWWQERVHPDDSALVSKSSEDHVAGRAPYFDSIYRMQHKNGSWRWVHSQGKVVSRDNDGRPLRMIGINRDITESKDTEEKLNEREEKYRTIFENAGDAIAIHDLNGHFIEVNDIICKRLGYSREELLTMTVGDVDDPAHARNVEGRIQELIKNGHVVFETVHITRDGRKIPVEASAVIFHLGDKPFIMSIARDITERKVAEEALLKNAEELHASYEELTASEEELRQNIDDLGRSEQALRENEEKFRVLSEQLILGIGIIQDGIFQYFNSGYCAISGYSKEEIQRWQPYEYAKTVHPDDLDFVTEQIQKKQMNSSDAVTHYSFRALNKEGAVLLLDLYSRTVMYHGRPADLVMFIDITGRKVAEESLQQANKKLTLLSSLTRHDIKNQLTVLLGYLDILEQKQPDPTLTGYFQKLTTAANRISSLIQFTKEYEKIGTNVPMWQDTRTLVETAIKQAPLGQVMVKNVFPDGAEVFADPLIVKVYYNLMDNAVRYGGEITTIRFSVEEHGDDHVIVCEDDGEGVALEDKEKIFERGFGKNTGLGLALSKEILLITGITIKETGEPGKGARFEMNVPRGAWRVAGKADK